jgi:hypothetical protein
VEQQTAKATKKDEKSPKRKTKKKLFVISIFFQRCSRDTYRSRDGKKLKNGWPTISSRLLEKETSGVHSNINEMAIISNIKKFIVKVLNGGCSDCGADVEGGYITHGTFGYIKTCCLRAAS